MLEAARDALAGHHVLADLLDQLFQVTDSQDAPITWINRHEDFIDVVQDVDVEQRALRPGVDDDKIVVTFHYRE